MKMKLIFVLSVALFLTCAAQSNEKKIVCYWNSNSHIHEGLPGEFHASDIDPTICTHIIYGHVYFSETRLLKWTPEDKTDEFLNLKTVNPDVKLLIGIGGPYWGTTIPSNLMSTATQRDDLATDIKAFLDQNNRFDGCDIDWQWPGQGNGSPSDLENFPKFLKTLNSKLSRQKILSISVAARNEDIQKSYDLPEIINSVDFININVYDMRGIGEDEVTAFHSPYSKDSSQLEPEADWNAVAIVKSWISRVEDPSMLNLGIATYGRSFTLASESDFAVRAAVIGVGKISEFLTSTRPSKINIIPYGQICLNLNNFGSDWKFYWSESHFAPYAVFDRDQWVGFDDEKSVKAKIHLVNDNGLGGLNYASLDYDDFAGNCGPRKFPLISMGYEALVNGNMPENPVNMTTTTPKPGVSDPTTTTTSYTTTTSTPTTVPDPSDTTTKKTTTIRSTTTTTKSTGTTEFKTPPHTPTTELSTTHSETPTSLTLPTQNNDGSDKSTTTTTTTSDFKTPPVTPTEPEKITTESGEEYEGSGEPSSESTEGSSEASGELSNENDQTTATASESGEITDDPVSNPDDDGLTTPNSNVFTCPAPSGNFRNPNDCTKFYICSHNIPYVFDCGYLYYNELTDQCDYPENVQC